jgi:hypothetical protein
MGFMENGITQFRHKRSCKSYSFTDPNLTNADLRGVKGLTVEQIQASQNWQYAIYDEDFHKKLMKTIPSQAEFDDRTVGHICNYPG